MEQSFGTLPAPSTASAHLICLLLATLYVGSVYLSKHIRISSKSSSSQGVKENGTDRDDPDVIRARLAAVTVATIASCIVLVFIFWVHNGSSTETFDLALHSAGQWLGFLQGWDLRQSYYLLPHLLTPTLFLGPLFCAFLQGNMPFQSNWSFQEDVVDQFFSLLALRNYWLAPLTEEIVFRSCILCVYHLSGASVWKMIFFGPLTFGLAHMHHAWDVYVKYGRTKAAVRFALMSSTMTLAYTTLFGFHASYLFLRTGSVLPSITAHTFCNVMGLPQIASELKAMPNYRLTIWTAYLVGIVGYIYGLRNWTLSPHSLYWQ